MFQKGEMVGWLATEFSLQFTVYSSQLAPSRQPLTINCLAGSSCQPSTGRLVFLTLLPVP